MTRRRTKQETAKAKNVAVYTRKSTSIGLEQDFNSLDAQRESCEAYVTSQGHQGWKLMTNRYDDGGFSGANIERPAFQKLLADVEAGKIDVIVVYKVDRLSRSLLDFAKLMDRFNRAGVAFVSVTQNFSTADAMGRLTLNMLMSFAEFEREMISERTRDKITAARRKGKWTGGQVPLGYEVVDKKLMVNDLEAVTVRALFDLYEERRSALATARALNDQGRTTKRHRAKNGNVRPGKPWGKAAVLRVLRNPIFAGYIPSRDELHEGEHQAIITRNQRARVLALLDGRGGVRSRPGHNPRYLLRGLLKCKHCGNPFTPASTRKNGNEYRYYRCTTRDKEGASACPSRPLPADAIEGFVVDQLRHVAGDEALAQDVTNTLKTRIAAERKQLATEREKLPIAIAKLSAEGTDLLDTLTGLDGPAKRIVEAKLQEVGETLGHQEARLTEVEVALAKLEQTEVEARWVAKSLQDFDEVWDAMTPANQGRLLRAMIKRIDVDEENSGATVHLADLNLTAPNKENSQ